MGKTSAIYHAVGFPPGDVCMCDGDFQGSPTD